MTDEMNLCDARVDLFGQLLAVGHMSFAPDKEGHFVPRLHDAICVSTRASSMRLAATTASRDEASGFLISEEVAQVVHLPKSLSVIALNALRRQYHHAIRAPRQSRGNS